MILDIEVFTGITIVPTAPAGNFTGHTEPAVFTPDGDGLTGTVAWGPSLGVEHGDDGVVCGYPDLTYLPDGAEIESMELLIEGGGTSTFLTEAQVAAIGAGADGVVTVTVGPGHYPQIASIRAVLAAAPNADMSVAYVNGPLIVTLGTDGAGVADPVKNTALLVADALSALPTTSAVASGTGATPIGVQGPVSFSYGFGFGQTAGSWSMPGTLLGVPNSHQGAPYASYHLITPATSPWLPWETWAGSNAPPQPDTHREVHPADGTPGSGTTPKEILASTLIGFNYTIMGAPDDETFTGEGSVTVTRFTLRVTYNVASVTFGVEAGDPQVVRGPLPSTVDLLATLSGDIDGDLTYEWTLEESPDMATIGSPDELGTTVTFDAFTPGDYKFKITVTILHPDTGLTFVVDDVVILTIRPATPPTVTSGMVRLGVYD